MEEIVDYIHYNPIVKEIDDIQRIRERIREALIKNIYMRLINLKRSYGKDIDVIIKEEGMKLLKEGLIKEVKLPNYEIDSTGIVWVPSVLFSNSYLRYLKDKYGSISCASIGAIYDISSMNDRFKILPIKVIEKQCNKNYIIMMLFIKPKKGENVAHMNVLLIDRVKKEIERFEPHGEYSMTEDLDEYLRNYAYRNSYTYLDPMTYCPQQSFQHFDYKEYKLLNYRKEDQPEGYCAAWSSFYVELRLQNLEMDRDDLVKEALKNLRVEGFNIYIKTYASNLMNELLKRIKDDFVPIKNVNNIEFVNKRGYILKKDGEYIPAYFVEKTKDGEYIFVLYGPKWVRIDFDKVEVGILKDEQEKFWINYHYLVGLSESKFEEKVKEIFEKKKNIQYMRDLRKIYWSK